MSSTMSQPHNDLWAFDAATLFPTLMQFPDPHIKLLDEFFRVVDACSTDPNASQGFGTLFTQDGVWKTPTATFSGTNEIMNSGHTWQGFQMTKTMRHWVVKLYVNDDDGKQLMILGIIKMEFLDERVVEKHFGAWVEIEDVGDSKNPRPKLKYFQGWSSQQ